tara:strand:+ start:176 stop:361 length:186 start_codon:yes stop_codon:yes gene_type:complete
MKTFLPADISPSLILFLGNNNTGSAASSTALKGGGAMFIGPGVLDISTGRSGRPSQGFVTD